MSNPLVTPEELARSLERPRPARVLDVRWKLGDPSAHAEFLAAHVPGAVYVDLDSELADPPSARSGRHPMPSQERLQRAVVRWGLRDDDEVVVTDGIGGMSAARAWWVLRDAGFERVRVLDGALDGWIAAGFPVESGDVPAPGNGTFVPRPGQLPGVGLDEVRAVPRVGVLLDARAGERYRGEQEPIDPRAGHIPGAVSAPTGDNLGTDGRFLAPEVLRDRFAELGVIPGRRVVAYCGSGVTAAHTALALTSAGYEPALFSGSWSQWSNHPDLPVALGAEPGVPD